MHFFIWVSLVPLLISVQQASIFQAFARFFLASFSFYLLLLQWLLCHVYWAGGWGIWAYVALSGFMASYWGGCGALWTWYRKTFKNLFNSIVLACLWTAMEWLQGTLFTGFGWGALAYSQGANPYILQWAAIGGTGIISFFIVLMNALLVNVAIKKKRRAWRLATIATLFVVVHVVGAWMYDKPNYEDNPFQIGIVQPNFPQEIKWDPEYSYEMIDKTIDTTREMMAVAGVDLVVWPEALIVLPAEAPGISERLNQLTNEIKTPLFTGISRFRSDKNGWTNSSCLVSKEGDITVYYDKIHLAPFGEYVPLRDYLPFITKLVPAIGDMVPGDTPVVFEINGRRLGPLICFEVLFPKMSEQIKKRNADCLLVITNLAWFGVSNALAQELEISRFRAVENRMPLIHCGNTGISGVFDPYGRFISIGEPYTRTFGICSVATALPRPLPIEPSMFSYAMIFLSGVIIIVLIVVQKFHIVFHDSDLRL